MRPVGSHVAGEQAPAVPVLTGAYAKLEQIHRDDDRAGDHTEIAVALAIAESTAAELSAHVAAIKSLQVEVILDSIEAGRQLCR